MKRYSLVLAGLILVGFAILVPRGGWFAQAQGAASCPAVGSVDDPAAAGCPAWSGSHAAGSLSGGCPYGGHGRGSGHPARPAAGHGRV